MDPIKKIKSVKKEIFNLEDLIAIRRNIHQYPEIGFQEFETQRKIKEFCLKSGLEESCFKVCATTGFCVDIYGTAQPSGQKMLVALRADIDALSMTEKNPHLEYESKTKAAHMCGHDGHVAMMLGFIQLYLERRDEIPSDKGVRILFQPSEEGPLSGAKQMIKEGCLDNVDECYGAHNWPGHEVGYFLVKPGPILASVSVIRIHLYGKGGHGSKPESAIDPVQMAVSFHQKFNQMKETQFKGRQMVCTIPVLQAGERYNVIASSAYMEGTLRSLEDDIPNKFGEALQQVLEEVKKEFPGSDYKFDYEKCMYGQLNNTEKETKIIENLAIEYFGEEKVGEFGVLPLPASEDFSFFTQIVPGVFYFLGGGRKMNDVMCHDCHFDFNDDLIIHGSKFFMKIVEDRFGLQKIISKQ